MYRRLRVPNQGYMGSAQGPLDVRPDFLVHDSTRQVEPYEQTVEYTLHCFALIYNCDCDLR